MRPAELEPEPLVRKDDIRNTMSEQEPSQEYNHSAIKEPACSNLHFQFKDHEPPNIEIEVTKKLKLPQAAERGMWKGIDEDLVMLYYEVVEKDDEKKLQKIEGKIYSYLEYRFGEEKKLFGQKQQKENRETKAIRVSKRVARKDMREAKRSKDSNATATAKKEYLRLVRLHNKSRRNELKKKRGKEEKREQEKFKKNPYDFSKKLLNGKQSNAPPSFSKEDADRFFKKEYSDKDRSAIYTKLEGLPEAKDPVVKFELMKLNRVEFDAKLKSRRNKSSPGPNGVPYVVYKRCPRITHIVFQILSSLWDRKIVPLQWRFGESVLIPKTEDLSDPSKFRNITKTNTSGKLNMGILADKMLDYMVSNKYIDKSVQKGFLKKTPGCLEHTQVLMEELKDAKSTRRQIFVVWVDLMNAYGRVPHNLLLYALRHYKFPEWLIEYMFKYYDELIVRVVTKYWKFNWFYYMLGLFQGDPLSVVLFLIVFNLLLDLLQDQKEYGYKVISPGYKVISPPSALSSEPTLNRAFANDLTLILS